MGELVKMISEGGDSDKIEFSREDNHLFFDMGKRLLVARMLTGQFPNFEAVLPRSNDRTVVINREEFTGAIRRVAILSDERSRTVRLSLAKGILEIREPLDLAKPTKPWKSTTVRKILAGFNYQFSIF
jgi:DNA polymerase-3 subunit beta